jgi:hypothetical protein
MQNYLLMILIGCLFTSSCAVVTRADKQILEAVKKAVTAEECINKIIEIPECQETAENLKDVVK